MTPPPDSAAPSHEEPDPRPAAPSLDDALAAFMAEPLCADRTDDEDDADPDASAAADLIARDILPDASSAAELVSSPFISLAQLRTAKSAFKMLRVVGETAAERRLGAELYAVAIGAALVFHGTRITEQSNRALRQGLRAAVNDRQLPELVRETARLALNKLPAAGPGPSSSRPAARQSTARPEIERRYLLRGTPALPDRAVRLEIEQGYLPEDDPLGGRLRRLTFPDGRVRRFRTVKSGQGLVRQEEENEIGPATFDDAWPRTHAARIVKTRYRIAADLLTWEIDVFADYDLAMAEVELPSPETDPGVPDWLAPWIVREVTDDPGYTNFAIAHDGPP